MSGSQKAQRQRQVDEEINVWRTGNTATGGPRLLESATPKPWHAMSKDERREVQKARRQKSNGKTESFEVNSNMLDSVHRELLRVDPGSDMSSRDLIHKALASYRSELKLKRKLRDKLESDLKS